MEINDSYRRVQVNGRKGYLKFFLIKAPQKTLGTVIFIDGTIEEFEQKLIKFIK
jgi:hypothetical protein